MINIENLKYPLGKPQIPNRITFENIENWIKTIEKFPIKVSDEIERLSNQELAYQYRPDGWNIKQVINHCIDSHMNSYIRFKLALTEENPIIKPYREDLWGELSDTIEYDLRESVILLNSIHKRWVFLLKSLLDNDLNKTFIHPDGNEKITLKENLCIYAWHCNHHLEHIINAKKYKYAK